MEISALVNELNNSSPNKSPKNEKTRITDEQSKTIRQFIWWLFGIVLSIGVLAYIPISLALDGKNINVFESIFYSCEIYFIGITVGASIILEYDNKKILDTIMLMLTLLFIILGAFMYSRFALNEYNAIVEALSKEGAIANAEQFYQSLSYEGEICLVYLIVMVLLGIIKYIQKILNH